MPLAPDQILKAHHPVYGDLIISAPEEGDAGARFLIVEGSTRKSQSIGDLAKLALTLEGYVPDQGLFLQNYVTRWFAISEIEIHDVEEFDGKTIY